jgi:methylenetetrahydrofolate dehydrogenase (NADP+)/methenyltetrahydrofolate cyclohydrolase
MITLSGTLLAAKMEAQLKTDVERMRGQGVHPTLAVLRAGEDPASVTYVRSKLRIAERLGVHTRHMVLPETVAQSAMEGHVRNLNEDSSVHGILCQLPLPGHLNASRIIALIDPLKDVDGLTPTSMGLLAQGEPRFVPCTPAGILALLAEYRIEVGGRRAVVLGRSNIVGRPVSILLSQKGWDATVTLCHRQTPDLAQVTRQADILVAAIGVPEFVTAPMVRQGAVVIDVGVNRVAAPGTDKGYRLCGDVDYAAVAPLCDAITPVPGGVGPMTVIMLMRNTLHAVSLRLQGVS